MFDELSLEECCAIVARRTPEDFLNPDGAALLNELEAKSGPKAVVDMLQEALAYAMAEEFNIENVNRARRRAWLAANKALIGGKLRKTGLPAYFKPPSMTADQAMQAQLEAILSWARQAVGYVRPEEEHFVFADKQDFIRAKAANDAEAMNAIAHRYTALRHPPRLFVTGAQGTGKSRALIMALARLKAQGLVVWVLVPTHERAEETLAEYNRAAALQQRSHRTLQAIALRGRTAEARESEKARKEARLAGQPEPMPVGMCARLEMDKERIEKGLCAIREAQKQKVDVENICKTCPLKAVCEYKRQAQESYNLSEEGGIFVMPHDYLYLQCPAPEPDLIIIDEAVRSTTATLTIGAGDPFVLPEEVVGSKEAQEVSRILRCIVDAVRNDASSALGVVRASLTAEELGNTNDVLREWQRPPQLNGNDSNAAMLAALKKGHGLRQWATHVRAIVRATITEYDMARASYRAIWTEEDKKHKKTNVRISWKRSLHVPIEDKPILYMDGTGSLDLATRVFPDLVHREFILDRLGRVVQSTGLSWSCSSLMGNDHASDEEQERARKKRDAVRALADNNPDLFLAMPMRLFARMQTEGLKSTGAHFNATRGLNRWERTKNALVVSCEQPPVEEVEAIARGYSATDPNAFQSVRGAWDAALRSNRPDFTKPLSPKALEDGNFWGFRSTRMRRMRDGTLRPIEVLCHPDPLCNAILEQTREAEVMQALDRVRGARNERNIDILNGLALPLAIDEERDSHDYIRAGLRLSGEVVKARGQGRLADAVACALTAEQAASLPEALILSGKWLAEAFPEAFQTPKAAESYLFRERKKGEGFYASISSKLLQLDGEAAPYSALEFVLVGKPGRPAQALIRADITNPEQALSKIVGGPVKII